MTDKKFAEYKEKLQSLVGDKYTIQRGSRPDTVKDKFELVCKKHGPFISNFDSLLNKKTGCPACAGRKIPTNEEFIERCKKVHAGKNYDFSLVQYNGSKKKVVVICNEVGPDGELHGPFEIRAGHLVAGVGCSKCSGRKTNLSEWIAKARKVHGDAYDYSCVDYTSSSEKVKIICHKKDDNGVEHGVFYQVASSHLCGCGCPKCKGGILVDNDHFIKKAQEVHNGYYDYSKVNYINARTPVEIICPRHGSFFQIPYSHLAGKGCQKCKSSKLEGILMGKLEQNRIRYEYQVFFPGLGKKSLDFFIPSAGVYIECQGEQHFMDTNFGGTKSLYKDRVAADKDKYEAVTSRGFNMLYYTVPEFFHENEMEPNYEFYEDKQLFTDVNALMAKIEKLTSDCKERPQKMIDAFYEDLKQIDLGFNKSGNKFVCKNIVIFYNQIKENQRTSMATRRKAFKRNKYQVYDIFEDEYVEHREIVLSKIGHLLGKHGHKIKIPGRKCVITEIDKTIAETFLAKYHIQGFAASSVYLGAYYNNELVGVMTFLREDNDAWNLNRFATNINYLCQGVGGKLFKWFLKEYSPIKIKSFADRRWTFDKDNNFYTKVGFVYMGNLSADYRYFVPGKITRHHKFAFRKSALSKKYGFPLTMTERQMTEKAGFKRIYDAGLYKFVWKR